MSGLCSEDGFIKKKHPSGVYERNGRKVKNTNFNKCKKLHALS
jgi:hypothetical protein